MKYVIAALMIAAPFLVPSVARADYADSLQAMHRRAVGYTFDDGTLRTLRYVDEDRDKNELRARTSVAEIGMVYRRNVDDIKAKAGYSFGFTGNVFWYSDENGFTVQVRGDSAKLRFDSQLVETDAVATLPWKYLRMDKLDGKDVAVVRVEPKNSFALELFIDPTSALYRQVTVDPKGDYERNIHVLDHAEVNGKKFISKLRYDDDQAVHTRSNFSINPILADTDLHPPMQTASWEFKNPDPFPIEVKHDRILVKAKVNGIEGLFMLDSGASNILVSGKFARRAGLKATGHSEVGGPSIDAKVDVGLADTIEIGGNTMHNVSVSFGTEELDEFAPDGLLGFDVFAGSVVTFDATHNTLRLQDPISVDVAAIEGIHAQVDLADGSPSVPMRIGDAVTLNAILDTGDPKYVLIPWDLPTKYGLRMRGGNECGELDNLILGPITLKSPGACRGYMDGRTALVGLPFFQGFDSVVFAYPSAELIFVPKQKKK